MNKTVKLIISIITPLFIGFFGSIFTSSSVNSWYLTLNKPFFNPPNWLFGPVWTLLYILMGISFYLIWQKKWGKKRNKIWNLYFGQLVLNFLWSIFFFGARLPLLALVEIFILWFVILLNIIIFYKISKVAAYLLIPYILWVTFATMLNFAIVILN